MSPLLCADLSGDVFVLPEGFPVIPYQIGLLVIIFIFKVLFIFVHLCISLYVPHVCKSLLRPPHPLELEVEAVVNCQVGTGN